MSLKTFRGYLIALEAGRISIHQALFQWTYIAAGNTTVSAIREYAPLVREWLPKAEWPPEGVHLKEPGYLEYTWHGPADFYEFADHRLGGAFEVGKFLAEFVAEHDPKAARAMLEKLAVDPEPKVGAPVGNQNASKRKNNPSDDANCFTPQETRAKENGIHPATQRRLDKIAAIAPDYLPRIAAKEISINKAATELGIVKPPKPRPTTPLEILDYAGEVLKSDSRIGTLFELMNALSPAELRAAKQWLQSSRAA